MTATALALTNLTANNGIDIPVGASIDQANGMSIALPSTAIPAAPNMDELMLFIQTTNGTDVTVTVKAGVLPPAFRSGMGDLVVTAHAASGGCVIGPLESARFAQADGSVLLAFQSGITGFITAYIHPSRW